jgi:hypothetical protein
MEKDLYEILRTQVAKYLERNWESCGIPPNLVMIEESRDHIISIGCSMLMTKHEFGYPGGGFVQSVVNNDLRGAVMSGDQVNLKCIPFYVTMLQNLMVMDIKKNNYDS